MTSEDDPFACFDSSDDDESDIGKDETGQQQQQSPRDEITRDPGNGVLAFHAGTEIALLHHLKAALESAKSTSASVINNDDDDDDDDDSSGIIQAKLQKAQTVLEIVDSYCLSRHWMMHVGPEKADPLRTFLGDALVQYQRQEQEAFERPFCIVELGTYCGYSSIFFAKTILEWSNDKAKTGKQAQSLVPDEKFSFHIYSVEVVEKFAAVANEMIRLAGMEDFVTVLLVKDPEEMEAALRRTGEEFSLSSELKQRLPAEPTIDFLFVDHDKSLYLPNLQELERNKMIQKGTHVAADNVVFAQIHDYRKYVASLAEKGIVTTKLEDSLFVEYCQPELGQLESSSEEAEEGGKGASTPTNKDMMRDGIEFTVYRRDPIL